MAQTIWAVPELYTVKFYTNLQQVYEYETKAYTINGAKNNVLASFNEIRLPDEHITKIEVIKLGLKAF